jgi:hypothetical protein
LTTKKKTNSRRKSSKGFDLNPYLIVVGLLLLALTIYGFRLQSSSKHLIPISVIALLAGVLFESKRLTEKWSTLLLSGFGSFIFSFFAFLPGKKEHIYNFEVHIAIWPYMFIFFFIFFSISFHGDKIIPKLTEGITLLQSIALIYWVVDYGFVDIDSLFLKSLMVVSLLFSLFSVFNAFTHTILSRTSRLTLSIWSSIIMLFFAAENIYRVYQNEQIENTADLTHGLYIGLQYFLLGISSIYIVHNFLMLSRFLPNKNRFFNSEYYRDIKKLKSDHIKRYSDRQVSILHSLFCFLFTSTIFFLNYYYQILPRHVAIWTVFVVFPFILITYEYATGKINYS